MDCSCCRKNQITGEMPPKCLRAKHIIINFFKGKIKMKQLYSLAFFALASLATLVNAADKFVYIPLSAEVAIGARKGWTDSLFGPLGYKVKVVDMTTVKLSGATVAALDRGDINFASAMAYMATDYKLNGYNTRVILAAQPTIRKFVITFVAKDSPYRTEADLKGKTLGTIRYCCGYAGALEIFQHAGYPIDTDLKKGDVRVWIAPGSQQNRDALISGRIDAVSDHIVAVPAHASAYLQGLYRVLDSLPDNSIYHNYGGREYYYGKADWVDKHPDLAQAFAKLLVKVRKWENDGHLSEAAQIASTDLRQPLGVTTLQIQNEEWGSHPLFEPSWDKTVESLKKLQVEYKNLGEPLYLKKTLSEQELESFVDKRFFDDGQYSAYN